MRFSRSTIAATATIAALGVLAAVALASGGAEAPAPPAPAAETDPPVEVRTETIRRTVHRRAKAARSDDDGTLDQGPGDAPRIPVAPAGAAASAVPAVAVSRRGGHDFEDHSGPGRGGHDPDDHDDDFDDHDDDFDDHFESGDDDGGHGRGRGRGRGRGGDDD